MINIKTKQEIEIIRQGGEILAQAMDQVLKAVKPGITEIELDKLAEEFILAKNAKPGFKKVRGYNYTLCVSTNEQVVHGIPTNYVIKQGDLVSIDCGVFYKGFFTDMSETIFVKNEKNPEIDKFLETGKRALNEAIKITKAGNRIFDISKTIQNIVEKENGYSIVRTLVGHGIGKDLHEEPEIPGFVSTKRENTPFLKERMVLAIEVIYNMGKADVIREKDDNWTIKTKDKSLSATFEKTVAVSENEAIIFTK